MSFFDSIPIPEPSEALDFLRKVHPGGPYVFTAIWPDRKRIVTRTFNEENATEALEWLRQHNGTANLYWSVNPPNRELDKKARREDILEVRLLHVDIDPRAGEDIVEERRRALALLTDRRPPAVPEPSFILDSGGGYQAFWLLADPLPIDGDMNRAEEAKRYNQQLEIVFGGDSCSNIDRIMRLPFTINIPDEKKRRKGRKPALATVVCASMDLRYPIERFTAAPVVQMAGTSGISNVTNTDWVTGNIERLKDIDELNDYAVPERIKIAIVQGKHPDEPKAGDNSRSAWVFDVACQLVRCKVPDEVIFSVFTDPDFGISESILEKGSSATRYAARQIERARYSAVDPLLLDFNDRFAVVGNFGGKCRVIEEVNDPVLNRARLVRQTFQDFKNRHLNRRVKADSSSDRTMPAGPWWLSHPARREFDRVVFAPGLDVPRAYNLWQGFAYEARPGNLHARFLEHLHTNVCSGEEAYFKYLIGWMARLVQQPGQQGEVAVVLRGGKGVGKSFVAREFGKLFGRHYLHISNPSHLVGNFNSHLRDVIFLFADEAFYAGDKKHESILKTLITEDTIQIEAKGVDVETSPNFVHLMMASNDAHVVRASGDERRFFVLEVSAGQQQQASYFGAIANDLKAGGYENLLHFLLTYDLSDYNVRHVPRTAALLDQQESTLEGIERLLFEMLKLGELPFHTRRAADGRPMVGTLKLQAYAQAVLKRDVTEKRIGSLFRELGAERKRQGGAHWMLPSLRDARRAWNVSRFETAWDDAADWHIPAEDGPTRGPF